ncbi:MAG: peptide chain release factor N(5)-glutamine methyltransferase [Oleispira antarctica]|nr:peptide chain release factor N(5)-glutamine methyltransferase [Oleispira antarctica]MBQ0793047.1 peptide chain release factor N(5)-glutamine methyltransferase [Oleispira antarctica]
MRLSIEQIINQFSQQLMVNSDTAKLDVELLLARSLGKDRTYLYTWSDKPVTEKEEITFKALFARRLKGEPVAYILEQQAFWDLELKTAEHTLIPRADTETLIEWVLELADVLPECAKVIDLGTGTGAIALSLAHEFPLWEVQGVDVIPQAVELAQHNAILNQLERVLFFQSSWFDQVEGRFDLIVSNPPYIDPDDEHLAQGDVRFEPKSALVADNKGLADLELIAEHSRDYLVEGGWLLVEHGYDQQSAVQQLLITLGYQHVATRIDLGGNPRITGGQFYKGAV